MRAWTTIVSLALVVGCVTDDGQKKKKKKDIQTSFQEDVITPQDAADFTDGGASFVPKQKFSSTANVSEDFTLDGSGDFEIWDAAASDEDLAVAAGDDVDEQDQTVHEPIAEANPLTEITPIKAKDAPPALEATSTKVHVLYVKRTQVPVRRLPDDQSGVSRTLDQGDTVVGTVEGEWARLHEGEWVHMKDLSWNPVGRSRTGRR